MKTIDLVKNSESFGKRSGSVKMTQKVAKRKFYATSGAQKQNGTRRDKDYNIDKNYKSSSEEKPAAIAQAQSKLSTEMRLKQEGITLVQDAAILSQKQDSLISN